MLNDVGLGAGEYQVFKVQYCSYYIVLLVALAISHS